MYLKKDKRLDSKRLSAIKAYKARRISFKGKEVYVERAPRIDVCNLCRAVKGEIDCQTGENCKRTSMHHEQYDESNPLRHTIEICVSCHRARHVELDWMGKDKECISCFNEVGKYEYSWHFNEPSNHIICAHCFSRYIAYTPEPIKSRKLRWIGKDSSCYACGRLVKQQKEQDKWIFNEPTSHILCGRCDAYIRAILKKNKNRSIF